MRFLVPIIPVVFASTGVEVVNDCQEACNLFGNCDDGKKVTFCLDEECFGVRNVDGLIVHGGKDGTPLTCAQASGLTGKTVATAAVRGGGALAAAIDPVTFGAVGMRNIGNTCYMNSVVQVLGHLIPVGKFFIELHQRIGASRGIHLSRDEKNVINGFVHVFGSMYSAEHVLDVGKLEMLRTGLLALRPPTIVDAFERNQQADASEAFLAIVHVLSGISLKVGGSSLEPVFGFRELEQTTCISCGRVFRPAEPDQLLIFNGVFTNAMRRNPVEPVDLIATLRARLSPEYVDRDICAENGCAGHSKAATARRVVVSEGPQILVVGLERKVFEGRTLSRINKVVRIPDRLNLEDLHENEGFFGRYRLVGLVHHTGSATGGHYISQFRNMVEQKKTVPDPAGGYREITERTWFEANDSVISEIGDKPEELSGTVTMIIYEKI